MKIIAGALRGRRVRFKDQAGVRPISGRIKQSVFDIVAGLVPGAKVLDLFAGTGAVGLEALSRGAQLAVFVDLSKACVAHIERALAETGFREKGRVLRGNALSDLCWLPYRCGVSQFDLVYLGPPYKDEAGRPLACSTPALSRLAEANLLSSGGWALLQRHVKEEVAVPPALERFRSEKYGDTRVDFFRRAG
ncbi:MAG: RsmD family RNA methyltransferase [Elusimicrobia bacterium]|nr:RsmD family RNA methyltransferase [Elusimicrobiota bacterium]MDE2236991.1 RsmD family RNA methyltransferase [Elusimicrobiota bacterium]MDE2426036.1 RsmD family RNA methyltransferase [Elusimicrobiota bacterium]